MSRIKVEVGCNESSFKDLSSLIVFQDVFLDFFDLTISEKKLKEGLEVKLKDDLKKHKVFIDREYLILRNFGFYPYLLAGGADHKPINEKISITLTEANQNLDFEYQLSPLEIWLGSLTPSERKNHFSSKFHPNRRSKYLKANTLNSEKLKKSFYEEQSLTKSNTTVQIQASDSLIKDIIGNEVVERCKNVRPLQYYQLIELLSDFKLKYGKNLKPLFNRLNNELNFELALEPIPLKLDPAATNDEQVVYLKRQYQNLLNFDAKKNVNTNPALLKEIMSLCLDAAESNESRSLIRVLPSLMEELIAIQGIASSGIDRHKINWSIYKNIAVLLNNSEDIFTHFALNLQLRLIGIKYRTKHALWRDVIKRSRTKISQNELNELKNEAVKQVEKLKKKPEVDLLNKNHKSLGQNKLAFQASGLLYITEKFNFSDLNSPDFPHLKTIVRMLNREKYTCKISTTNLFLEKYSTAHTRGQGTVRSNLLKELERGSRLVTSLRANGNNVTISSVLDKTHLHYWELLFQQTLINESNLPIDYSIEKLRKQYTETAWACFTKKRLFGE